MLANYHTHTTFCDGENTPEEIVRYAIEQGFFAIGFSGHGYTPYDDRYCMRDTAGYIAEVRRLQAAYREKIQIYLGVEEDAFSPVSNREDFDYIIGSCHYFYEGGMYYPIDSDLSYFKRCLSLYHEDVTLMAHTYYAAFCRYIEARRPDVIGHFDLLTKFEDITPPTFTGDPEYRRIADAAIDRVLSTGAIVEVNTGAISRGLRKAPYPSDELLHTILRRGGRVTLSSDSHCLKTLTAGFDEAKSRLHDIGFRDVYVLQDGRWTAVAL